MTSLIVVLETLHEVLLVIVNEMKVGLVEMLMVADRLVEVLFDCGKEYLRLSTFLVVVIQCSEEFLFDYRPLSVQSFEHGPTFSDGHVSTINDLNGILFEDDEETVEIVVAHIGRSRHLPQVTFENGEYMSLYLFFQRQCSLEEFCHLFFVFDEGFRQCLRVTMMACVNSLRQREIILIKRL